MLASFLDLFSGGSKFWEHFIHDNFLLPEIHPELKILNRIYMFSRFKMPIDDLYVSTI